VRLAPLNRANRPPPDDLDAGVRIEHVFHFRT